MPHINLVRMENDPQGSQLWNLAWTNKHLIQKHCFWEIRNGNIALFWHDSWDQKARLDTIENLNEIRISMQHTYTITVQDYWNHQNNSNSPWQRWTTQSRESPTPDYLDLSPFVEELATRRIRIWEGPDILR